MLERNGNENRRMFKLTWANLETERKTITLNNPEKNGNPRIFDISGRLVNMLAVMPRTNEYTFGTCSKVTRGSVFYRLRKNSAETRKPKTIEHKPSHVSALESNGLIP
jgi:hypothetical protein